MNCERRKITGRSSALAASLVLHGLVLFSLGVAGTSGRVMESSIMITYLAMPAPLPVKTPDMKTAAGKMTATRPAKASTETGAFPNPANVKPQPTPELETFEKEPIPKLPIKPAAGDVKEAGFEDGNLDPSEFKTEEASEAVISDNTGITVHESESWARDSRSLAVNSQFSNLDSQSPPALLAFAGDPVSLGMLGLDAVGPDLVEARILFLPEPVYPVLSRKRGEEGRVLVEVEIGTGGSVLRAHVKTSSSYPRLDRAALDAIREAVFSPAVQNGRSIKSMKKVAYRFELESR